MRAFEVHTGFSHLISGVFAVLLTGFGVTLTEVLILSGLELIFSMFWICAESCVDNTGTLKLFLSSVCTEPKHLCFSLRRLGVCKKLVQDASGTKGCVIHL